MIVLRLENRLNDESNLCATTLIGDLLEDWFDPRRLQDDYVPTGFKGAGVTARPVKGHRFGLGLSASDRQALILFLKTL